MEEKQPSNFTKTGEIHFPRTADHPSHLKWCVVSEGDEARAGGAPSRGKRGGADCWTHLARNAREFGGERLGSFFHAQNGRRGGGAGKKTKATRKQTTSPAEKGEGRIGGGGGCWPGNYGGGLSCRWAALRAGGDCGVFHAVPGSLFGGDPRWGGVWTAPIFRENPPTKAGWPSLR